MNILSIDIGGSHVKFLASGRKERREFDSGSKLTPELMVAGVKKQTEDWPYDVVSIGYPGPVLRNRLITEPHNLGKGWVGFDFQSAFNCPVKIINDAAMQALGSYQSGNLLFLGLGTGLGTTMIVDGEIEPMELGHLPYKKATYEDYVGLRGLKKHGKKKWRKYVEDVVKRLSAALEPDDIVLGGGNVKKLKELPPGCRAGDNANAFTGGFLLWKDEARESQSGIPNKDQQLRKIRTQAGLLAALDQSGGSTPKALMAYGLTEDAWSDDDGMFELVHEMRARIITTHAFNGDRVLASILFEGTMDRDIQGRPTADYLWNVKRIVPFLKVDKGLAEESDGVQLMKAMPDLGALLARAVDRHIFGTKMRAVIRQADAAGVRAVVAQQFEVAASILAAGLMPIIEPEVDIHCPDKAGAETLLKAALIEKINSLPTDQSVMLKLTLPERDDFYQDLVTHPKILKIVALSGGYSRDEGNARLSRNHGVIASFSRALVEGLSAHQSDADFNVALDASIQSIYEASIT